MVSINETGGQPVLIKKKLLFPLAPSPSALSNSNRVAATRPWAPLPCSAVSLCVAQPGVASRHHRFSCCCCCCSLSLSELPSVNSLFPSVSPETCNLPRQGPRPWCAFGASGSMSRSEKDRSVALLALLYVLVRLQLSGLSSSAGC